MEDQNMRKTALVFGATGLVGRCVVNDLRKNPDYARIVVFNRKEQEYPDPRISQVITDLVDPDLLRDKLHGDELYICLGTTIKKAGSVKEMERIDRDIPVALAAIAAENGVGSLAVVSSIGAKAGSRNYYLRIKGEMEKGMLDLPFRNIAVVRPSMLLGDRDESRFGEMVGKVMMQLTGFLMVGRLKNYKAIKGCHVAKAMVRILAKDQGKRIYQSGELAEMIAG